MRSRAAAVAVALSTATLLVATIALAAPAEAKPRPGGGDASEVYVGTLTPEQFESLREVGVDSREVVTDQAGSKTEVEVVLSQRKAAQLAARGVPLQVKKIDGKTASEAMRAQAAAGWDAYRSYSQPGGIRDELAAAAARYPKIAKLVRFGTTVQGKPMYAVKVTKNARWTRDGSRPATAYVGAQHAREWITVEMTRRLLHHVLDGYGTDATITNLVNQTELWFVPVANPDGYDYTFTPGNRLWRKNLRDNNGDGQITNGDGVDLNRNYSYKWGFDNEGSSPDPASETYRGPGPGSEPETKALDRLFRKVGFEFFINYHSAAELILYGVGWQVSTPTPDDVIYEAMAGDDAEPAVPGYDPDISAELYTTNGDTDTHMTIRYKTLGFTPEMTTCETVSDSIPDDEWEADDCVSGFNFPDDEELIQAEFEKNIPFAIATGRSALDPDDPVSVVGEQTPDFRVDSFPVSYGRTQPVATLARRSLRDVKMRYVINGGRPQTAGVREWRGGKRYGQTHDDYFAELRGTVRGARAGDQVEVWFTGRKPGQRANRGIVASEHFTYTVSSDIGGKVLILAAEDVTGASPVADPPLTSAQYADEVAASLTAAGKTSDVYDIDTRGRQAPHPLGVLAHYRTVVWETGDDIIPRNPGQVSATANKAALDTELAVRDYLNEGGKLLLTGKYAEFAPTQEGYWYNPFVPEQPECATPGDYPCLPLLNDFTQYWLGSYNYVSDGGTDPDGRPFPPTGAGGAFSGWSGELNAAGSANNQDHTASFLPLSGILPPEQFPWFGTSTVPVDWVRPGADPFEPYEGDWYAFSGRGNVNYKRLSQTVDLSGKSAADLKFWTSYDTEAAWDFLFVEAHEVGTDTWTTLPEATGKTSTSSGDSCEAGWRAIHPFLDRYQGADCSGTGTTGTWNAASGQSGGWQEWSVDLSAYAGKQVELSISYVTDWSTEGLGVFVDDVRVSADGAPLTSTGFETDLGGWTISGPAPGSAANNADWTRTQLGFEEGSVVTTPDTVWTGFGIEGLAPAARNDFVKRALAHLDGSAARMPSTRAPIPSASPPPAPVAATR